MDVVSENSGTFLIVSFPEVVPGDATLYFIQDNHIGGIILFADHCRDQDGLKNWLADFKKTLGRPLMVAVDQEGGRVRRFGINFPMLEAPRYYGRHSLLSQYQSDLSRVCERLYEIGVNLNFIPTVDLFDTEEGHVLDTRTFSNDPQIVSQFARATIEIHHRQGLLTCAKHFPGLGRSQGDPHLVPAASNLGDDDFRKVELPPFKDSIEAGVDAVMVTHLDVPEVDNQPAIVSQKVINGWLKTDLDFSGTVVTDDLLMEGAAAFDPVERLAIRSFAAGSDILLFGQNLKRTREAYEAFSEAWYGGFFDKQRGGDATKRVDALMHKIVS
jgi:beta-N-acetylhexosaminidase